MALLVRNMDALQLLKKLPITVIAVQEPDLRANKTDASDKFTERIS